MSKIRRWFKVEPQEVTRGATEVEQAFLAYVAEIEESYGFDEEMQYVPSSYSLERKGETDAGTLWCVFDYMYGTVYVLDSGESAEVFLFKAAREDEARGWNEGDLICREDLADAIPLDELGENTDEAIAKWLATPVVKHDAYRPIVKDATQRYTLGVAYPADEVDSHGDFTDADELEAAAWTFMVDVLAKGAGGVGTDHAEGTDDAAQVVESYIYRGPDWTVDGEAVAKSGDWMVGAVWTPEAWERIERGELTGWSIQGLARIDDEAEAPEGDG